VRGASPSSRHTGRPVVKVMLETEAVARLMAFRNLAGYLALEGCRSPPSLQFLNLGGFGRPFCFRVTERRGSGRV
jgi:hypothetical protein